MAETKIIVCENCGSQVDGQGKSFCPYCGGFLRGDVIEVGDVSPLEMANAVEDSDLKKVKGIEYYVSDAQKAVMITMGIIAPIALAFVPIGILVLIFGKDEGIVMLGWISFASGLSIGGIMLPILIMMLSREYKMKRFVGSRKKHFFGVVRGISEEDCVTIRPEINDGCIYQINMPECKEFYIGERVDVICVDDIFMVERADFQHIIPENKPN